MTGAATSEDSPGLPRIPLNLWDHKLSIALHWTALLISGGILPIVLYFALRYGAHLKLSTVLAVTTAIFGVVSLFSLGRRTWALLRRSSTCRPLGGSRWQMDYFNWNFIIGFLGITVVIVIGNIKKDIRVVALGLSILLIDVCGQLVLLVFLAAFDIRCPLRISSVPKGDRIRSGVYAIAEDIVAVDGGQGQAYREALKARYFASTVLRSLCFRLDVVWGVSGVAVGVATVVLLFVLSDENLAYILGWVIPWGFAGIMALSTVFIAKSTLNNEHADAADDMPLQA